IARARSAVLLALVSPHPVLHNLRVRSISLFVVTLVLLACGNDRRTVFSDGGQDVPTPELGTDVAPPELGTDQALSDGSADAPEQGPRDASNDAPADAPTSGSRPGPGELAVVEIQGNPVRANDDEAEYIELLNVSERALDLNGVSLAWRSFTAGNPDPSAQIHAIDESIVLAPGARALLGRSGGGFFGAGRDPDHIYEGVLFMNGDLNRLRVLTPTWDGTEPPNASELIDEVLIEDPAFENNVRGRAYQFNEAATSPSASANDDAINWCTSSTAETLEYRGENFGTPGAPNEC
ncbi:MAG: hypothetical protein AAF411_19570, partial [Myxococcota bacterium]